MTPEEKIADLKANFDYVLEGKDVEIMELKETLAQTIENDEVAYETLKLHDQEEIGMLKSGVAELEKENAKLKSEKGCETCTKFDKVQLTKAKEIIRQLLLLPYANNEEVYADVTSILDKAEQFLKQE